MSITAARRRGPSSTKKYRQNAFQKSCVASRPEGSIYKVSNACRNVAIFEKNICESDTVVQHQWRAGENPMRLRRLSIHLILFTINPRSDFLAIAATYRSRRVGQEKPYSERLRADVISLLKSHRAMLSQADMDDLQGR